MLKDEKKKQVSVYHKPIPGGKTAITDYKVLETRGELSLVEIGLETGRTHQIRATMADLGCPLLGDGKYGRGDVNRRYGETRQALYAYKLTFDLPTDAGHLNYLRGQSFTVENVRLGEKRKNPLTFPALLYIVYSPSFDRNERVNRRAAAASKGGYFTDEWRRINVQRVDSPAGSLHGV